MDKQLNKAAPIPAIKQLYKGLNALRLEVDSTIVEHLVGLAHDAISEIAKYERERERDKWVKVEGVETMPKTEDEVWVCYEDGTIGCDNFIRGMWIRTCKTITHWQPVIIPMPPKD